MGMDMSQLTKPPVRFLLPSSLLAAVAGTTLLLTYVWLVQPANDRLSQAQSAYQQAKHAEERGYQRRALFERVRMAQEHLRTIWQRLPARDQYAALAMAIAELGKTEQVTIPGMSYHVEKTESSLPVKATLTFRVTGDYDAVYRFIHRLETSDPYVVIESLDATRAEKGLHSSSNLVVFNVTVATFLQPTTPTKEMS